MEEFAKERLPHPAAKSPRLSYKFQRLRERLREAIETGVLQGKLPGERALARQFRVNAKTLSKALTDLAAEGLLERTIGRGTFVRGQSEGGINRAGKWLILFNPGRTCDGLADALAAAAGESILVSDPEAVRPSMLSGVTAAIDVHGTVPETTQRDLLLRGIKFVLIDRAPSNFSAFSVLIDRVYCVHKLSQKLVLAGHQHIGIVGSDPDLLASARHAARRLEERTELLSVSPDDTATLQKLDAVITQDFVLARRVRDSLERAGRSVPGDVSLLTLGVDDGLFPAFSGIYLSRSQIADTIRHLLAESNSTKPRPIWLVGSEYDNGTLLNRVGNAVRAG